MTPAPRWLVRVTKAGVTVEGRGATEVEARFDACRQAFQRGRP